MAFVKVFENEESFEESFSSSFFLNILTETRNICFKNFKISYLLLFHFFIRGGSRAAAISKMNCFVIIVNGWKPLTIITKRFMLHVAAALDPPLLYVMKFRRLKVH